MVSSANDSTILIVKNLDSLVLPLVECMKVRGESFDVASQVMDAVSLLANKSHQIILCDWRIFSCCCELEKEQLIPQLLHHPAPLILVSAVQPVAVRFRSLRGHAFYCYRISTLINRYDDLVQLSLRAKQLETRQLSKHPVPSPHFPTGLVVPFPQTTANWHLFQ